ncbi:unnamed protein product [Effrenium voratum]|nr:unnamed protein product [Effrenium voratum]
MRWALVFTFACAEDFDPRLEAPKKARRHAIDAFSAKARRCDLPRVDGAKLGDVAEKLRGRPALVRMSASKTWQKAEFLREFGAYRVKTNNGHFDFLRSKAVVPLAEYLSQELSESNLFFADMAYSLQRDVWSALGPLPPALRTFDARPILSVGVKGSSTRSHQHSETWQLLLAGAKAWWLAKPGTDLDKLLLGDPCEALRHVKGAAPAKRSGLGEDGPGSACSCRGRPSTSGTTYRMPPATCRALSWATARRASAAPGRHCTVRRTKTTWTSCSGFSRTNPLK